MGSSVVTDTLGRLGAAVVLATVTGIAAAVLASIAESSPRSRSYSVPHQVQAFSVVQQASGHIVDPRHAMRIGGVRALCPA